MTRPLRIQYPGAVYHITCRGNERRPIYSCDVDRHLFLKILSDVIDTHNVICHAYCLMGNHYHLLIETPDGNLSQFMRDLNGNYTQAFNQTYDRTGHLFEGRFKSFVSEKESYLLEVARYVVLNPVRANMVEHPKDYYWSSYLDTAGMRKAPAWLHTDWIRKLFGKDKQTSAMDYAEFVARGAKKGSPFDEVEEGMLLGSPQFVSWIWENFGGEEENKDLPRTERMIGRPSLEVIFQEMFVDNRDMGIAFAKIRCGYLNAEIARQLQLDRSTVGKIARSQK
jgi:REP element-mobilizing transposase RayT